MKKKLTITGLLLSIILSSAVIFTGCTEASQVSYNVSQEAENFNVLRRFAVINTRTDKVEFELIGAFSLEDESGNELSKKVYVTCEMEDGSYKKHIIGLNKDTFYVVEDLGGAEVNKYKYQVNYIPETIVPFTITKHK